MKQKFIPSDIQQVMNDIFVAVKQLTGDETTIVSLQTDSETPPNNLKLIVTTKNKIIPFYIEDFNLFIRSRALLDYCVERLKRELKYLNT